jgi:hypothetical protein
VDDADRAQVAIERTLAAQLEHAAALARTVLGHHATSTICSDCGMAIEAPRIAHGFATCASCARELWDMEMRRLRR